MGSLFVGWACTVWWAVCVVPGIVVLKCWHTGMCMCACGGDVRVIGCVSDTQWWLDGVSMHVHPLACSCPGCRVGRCAGVFSQKAVDTFLGTPEGPYTIREREPGSRSGLSGGASIPGNWDLTLPAGSWGLLRASQPEATRTSPHPGL